jgi:hypothetical protein
MTTIPPSNLPSTEIIDSANQPKKFFNTYYNEGITVSSNIIDAATGFFESRGFDVLAAKAIANVLISQSKVDNVNVFQLIDTLKGLSEVQLSRVVTEILNYNRISISTLGYRVDNTDQIQFELRNIVA